MNLLRRRSVSALIQLAVWLTLGNMALQIWAVLVPTALPVMSAMSFGMALGGASLVAYLGAVFLERRTLGPAFRQLSTPPPAPRDAPEKQRKPPGDAGA